MTDGAEHPLWQLIYDSEADVEAHVTVTSDHAEHAMAVAMAHLTANFPNLGFQPVGIEPEGEGQYRVSFVRL